jgi:hypothetical protein
VRERGRERCAYVGCGVTIAGISTKTSLRKAGAEAEAGAEDRAEDEARVGVEASHAPWSLAGEEEGWGWERSQLVSRLENSVRPHTIA